MQVLNIREEIRNYNLSQHTADELTWLWEPEGVCSAKVVYKLILPD
jgi:hypothetical protein